MFKIIGYCCLAYTLFGLLVGGCLLLAGL